MARIKIDPITRIEGHLSIEVEVENGVVTDAWSAGNMVRGWELILEDKDPRDAPYITSRICGVCEGVHTIASAHALDDAYGVDTPEAGRLMRNLFCSGMYMADHYIHFYVLSALDYLDIMAIAGYTGNDPGLLAIKDKIVYLVQHNDTSPFTPRYEPDEYSISDPETVTTLVSHYLKAIELKAKSGMMLSAMCGVQPHPNTINVGGCMATPTREQLLEVRALWEEQLDFVTNTYIPDVTYAGTDPLLPLLKMGLGGGHPNYLCYRMFPDSDVSGESDRPFGGGNHLFRGGTLIGDPLGTPEDVDYGQITEAIEHSWYDYPEGTDRLHPSEGVTKLNPHKEGAYSFIKSPRYNGHPMEVGPLARGLVNKYPELVAAVTDLGAKPGAVARHYCRALESKTIGEAGLRWLDRLIDIATEGPIIGMKDIPTPKSGQGFGTWDAPRGSLGHWVTIEGGRIAKYQCIVPSTWNASPRDELGQRGPYEEALIGAPVPDTDNPINLVRIVRSFDPCLACAIHLIDPETNDIKIHKVV